MATPAFYPQRSASASSGLPPVRLEVRGGSARPAVYDLTGEEFLIGSVPGCDLRLPGTNLPPVLCLIARQPDGVRLRKLAPTLPVLLNGQPISQTAPAPLTHGDCISIGVVDLFVSIDFQVPTNGLHSEPRSSSHAVPLVDEETRKREWAARLQEIESRERAIDEATQELESDRVLWYRRREEIERELQQAREQLEKRERAEADLTAAEQRFRRREEELHRREEELNRRQDEVSKLREETLTARREVHDRLGEKRDQLAREQESARQATERVRHREENWEAELAARRQAFEDELQNRRREFDEEMRRIRDNGLGDSGRIREQLEQEILAKYRRRAEELDRFQLSLREAAVQLRERKEQLDVELSRAEPRLRELDDREQLLDARREELDARAAEIQHERSGISVERQARFDDLEQRERELAERESALKPIAEKFLAEKATVDTLFAQYQADLVRLDRRQELLDQRETQLRTRAIEIDRRFEQFERDSRDFEQQVLQLDAREEQFRAEESRQTTQREELDRRESNLNERLAQVEGQQVALAVLRTRLEQMREETRSDAASLADERNRMEDRVRETQERLLEAERLREETASARDGEADAERVFRERSGILQEAVLRLRDLQQQLTTEDERLRTLNSDLQSKEVEIAEREALVAARTEQLREEQTRLESDRETFRIREAARSGNDEAREALQDQLRNRAEELAARQRELDEHAAQLEEQTRLLQEQNDALENTRVEMLRTQSESHGRTAETEKVEAELQARADALTQRELGLAELRRQLDEARARWEQEQRDADAESRKAREEIETLRESLTQRANELFDRVPDLEHRAQSALERTLQARETMRGQLSELHAYARRSEEDLETLRNEIRADMERLHQQETMLNRSRGEHRLSVASFRQQLVEWQSRFTEMRQSLTHGESRLERREKEVTATSEELAKQKVEIQAQHQVVVEQRSEMEHHLHDMRDWYRKKLREMVESRHLRDPEFPNGSHEPSILPMPTGSNGSTLTANGNGVGTKSILSMHDDLDPGDRKLGELLRSLELIDAETIEALWSESHRQHRPLRQVLLSGGYLTLYQLALIESGNLGGLVLGRFRVIDRFRSSPRETIYRVFDPRSTTEPRPLPTGEDGIRMLRILGELEMHDAVRPDEYRQRFMAARDVAHPNLAATLEVLDISGRPAVVQECLNGLRSSEWPYHVGIPGVWYRLLSQAAIGLFTAHQAGLIHGKLDLDSFMLTPDGTVKITGFGEPPWLQPSIPAIEPSLEGDLRNLGQVVSEWMQLGMKRKNKKPFPAALSAVLSGLGATTTDGVAIALYPSAGTLLEELDRAGREVPADSGAWERLIQHVVEHTSESSSPRQSA